MTAKQRIREKPERGASRKGWFIAAGAFIAVALGLAVLWSPGGDGKDPQENGPAADTPARKGRTGQDAASRIGRAGEISMAGLAEMLAKGEAPQLSRRQVDEYLEKNGRKVRGLLAAYQLLGDADLLAEAAAAEPENAYVLMKKALDGSNAATRNEILATLTARAATNSLPEYLIAWRAFAEGRRDDAIAALENATARQSFNTYQFLEKIDMAAIYQSAGYTQPAARVAALSRESRDAAAAAASVGQPLGREVAAAVAAGRTDDALHYAEMGLKLAERLRASGSLEVQGLAAGLERATLAALPQDAVPVPGGPSAGELLAQSDARAGEVAELKQLAREVLSLPIEEQGGFLDVMWKNGEAHAARSHAAQLRGEAPPAGGPVPPLPFPSPVP